MASAYAFTAFGQSIEWVSCWQTSYTQGYRRFRKQILETLRELHDSCNTADAVAQNAAMCGASDGSCCTTRRLTKAGSATSKYTPLLSKSAARHSERMTRLLVGLS